MRSLYLVARDKHSLIPISLCHSLGWLIDFRSVGVKDAIMLLDTIKGKGFLRSWCFP